MVYIDFDSGKTLLNSYSQHRIVVHIRRSEKKPHFLIFMVSVTIKGKQQHDVQDGVFGALDGKESESRNVVQTKLSRLKEVQLSAWLIPLIMDRPISLLELSLYKKINECSSDVHTMFH